MCKKILVVTASPRRRGNTTLLAEALIEGAEEKGHEISLFDVNKYDVRGCRACNGCWKSGRPCAESEDFNSFADMVEKVDVVVFASPVYWGTYPAPLKALVDKMYCFAVPWCEKDISGKKTLLLSCGDGSDESAFNVINMVHEGLAGLLGWDMGESVEVFGMVAEGDINKTELLQRARKVGRNL